MAHVLTESPTFDSTVTVPDDGDARNAASVVVGFQALANRTRAIHDNRLIATFNKLRFQSIPGVPVDPTQWSTISPFQLTSQSVSAQRAYFALHLAAGTLADVYVLFQGGAGHGALPATMPTAKLWRQSDVDGSATQIGGTKTDAAATTAAFEAYHCLGPSSGLGPTWTGLSESVVDGTRYIVEINSEGSTNAVVGDIFYGVLTAQTFTQLEVG